MAAVVMRRPRRAHTMTERPLGSLFDELTREFFTSWSTSPRMCMWEDRDELVIQAELPGVKKDDIEITGDSEMLNIRAEKKEHEAPESAVSYTCERAFGSLSRSIALPFPVDFEKATSHLEDGLLEIRLPKSSEAKARHIEIK